MIEIVRPSKGIASFGCRSRWRVPTRRFPTTHVVKIGVLLHESIVEGGLLGPPARLGLVSWVQEFIGVSKGFAHATVSVVDVGLVWLEAVGMDARDVDVGGRKSVPGDPVGQRLSDPAPRQYADGVETGGDVVILQKGSRSDARSVVRREGFGPAKELLETDRVQFGYQSLQCGFEVWSHPIPVGL